MKDDGVPVLPLLAHLPKSARLGNHCAGAGDLRSLRPFGIAQPQAKRERLLRAQGNFHIAGVRVTRFFLDADSDASQVRLHLARAVERGGKRRLRPLRPHPGVADEIGGDAGGIGIAANRRLQMSGRESLPSIHLIMDGQAVFIG